MALCYAGIGSRKSSTQICDLMTRIAVYLREKNYWLRTGAADGADLAFAKGAIGKCIYYLPWQNYNWPTRNVGETGMMPKIACTEPTEAAINLAGNFHPAWQNCKDSVKKMHGRNMHIISGTNLDSPVRFVVAYCEYDSLGGFVGGTGQALRYAKSLNLPIINLYDVTKYYSMGDSSYNKVIELIESI